MKYLLDTDVVVGYLRDRPGKRPLVKKLYAAGDLKMSLVTYGELEYGAVRSGNYLKEKENMNGCFADLDIEVVPLTQETMETFAKTKRALEIKGEKLDNFDLLIGATAVEHDLILVTDNVKHFKRFPRLKLYDEKLSNIKETKKRDPALESSLGVMKVRY